MLVQFSLLQNFDFLATMKHRFQETRNMTWLFFSTVLLSVWERDRKTYCISFITWRELMNQHDCKTVSRWQKYSEQQLGCCDRVFQSIRIYLCVFRLVWSFSKHWYALSCMYKPSHQPQPLSEQELISIHCFGPPKPNSGCASYSSSHLYTATPWNFSVTHTA